MLKRLVTLNTKITNNKYLIYISYHEQTNASEVPAPFPVAAESQITTNLTEYTLDSLLAGRRYLIAVQALSKGVASNASDITRYTRPAAPLIQELRSIDQGLMLSWRSDVNSRQDRYEVHYQRNGTREERTMATNETSLTIHYLHPGSGYEVKVHAISHGVRSEPHSYFQAVCKYFTNCNFVAVLEFDCT